MDDSPEHARFQRPSDPEPPEPINAPTPDLPPSARSANDAQPVKPRPRPVYLSYGYWWLVAGSMAIALIVVIGAVAVLVIPDDPPAIQPVLVTFQLNGESYPVTSEARTVADFLVEQNLRLDTGDILIPEPHNEVIAGMTIRLDRARTVSLTVDGLTSVLRTTLDSPMDILSLAGQVVNPADRIEVNGQLVPAADLLTWPDPVNVMVIRRAVAIQVVDGDLLLDLESAGHTVGEVLSEAGIELFLADTVQPDLGAPVQAGMQIVIDRSRPMVIIADGTRTETRVNGATIADALVEAGVVLSGLDYTVPDESTGILPGMSVRVIRVTEELITEQDPIPYEIAYQADNTLELDRRNILQAGQNGILERTIRVRYENGIEISRTLESEIVTRQPQNQITGYGTNIVVRTIDTPDGPLQYWRKLNMYATSYYPAAFGIEGDAYTSIGEVLRNGIIAIDPRIVAYRTNMYVPGYGVGFAADTGGPRSTPYWVDLGYSNEDWISWSQWVDVYLLLPVPETVNYLLPYNERGGPIP